MSHETTYLLYVTDSLTSFRSVTRSEDSVRVLELQHFKHVTDAITHNQSAYKQTQ